MSDKRLNIIDNCGNVDFPDLEFDQSEVNQQIDAESILATTACALKEEVIRALGLQGYTLTDNSFHLSDIDKEKIRSLHSRARLERIYRHIKFMESKADFAQKYMLNSDELEVDKIAPRIIEVSANSKYAKLFQWWNLVWWSLPCERAYGRQMRFVIWDDYHDAPIGLVGLQSPILKWKVRDDFLGIDSDKRDYWINQSMNAQRLGSLPPYNKFLGGKLVSMLMSCDEIRKRYQDKYDKRETLLIKRVIPSNLLFITTTGAYGKSSVYNRLRFKDSRICEFIGYTNGSGSFHIPDTLYESLMNYLSLAGIKVGRYFGSGPSVKIKNIDRSMRLLGFKKGSNHGIKRASYIFPLVDNLHAVLQKDENPIWKQRSIDELTEFWKQRWAVKRTGDYPKENLVFKKDEFMLEARKEWEQSKTLFEIDRS